MGSSISTSHILLGDRLGSIEGQIAAIWSQKRRDRQQEKQKMRFLWALYFLALFFCFYVEAESWLDKVIRIVFLEVFRKPIIDASQMWFDVGKESKEKKLEDLTAEKQRIMKIV